MPLDDTLLEQFIHGFFGYGNLRASTWFIGIEEGGGNSVSEIASRLKAWRVRGCQEVDDLVEFHRATGDPDLGGWFGPDATFQSTWGRLIRIYLTARNQFPTVKTIVDFQANEWGRAQGDTALLELFPLPSRKTNRWQYDTWSALPYLRSRRVYQNTVNSHRVTQLRRLIDEHEPRNVVFYGTEQKREWGQLAGTELRQHGNLELWTGTRGATAFALIPHPTYFGIKNTFLEEVGRQLRAAMGSVSDPTEEVPSAKGGLAPGKKVRHSHFGVGQVVAVHPSAGTPSVEVAFDDHGTKKVLLDPARFEIL